MTFTVSGDGAAVDVTYGAAGSTAIGREPMNVTQLIPASPPVYYSISAQLQGSGSVSVALKVDGKQLSSGVAHGGYGIASAEISMNPLTGAWADDNS